MIAYLVFVFVKITLRVVETLPLPILRSLARGLGCLAWWLDFSHRRLALKNVALALGEKNFSVHVAQPHEMRSEHKKIARESFIRMIENMFFTVWMARRDDLKIQRLFEVTGIHENLLPAIAKKRGVIHVMFHLGNWEVLSRMVGQIPEVKFSTIYQPIKNPHLNQLVAKWRSRSGVDMINRHHGFSEAIKRLRQGEAVGMLIDQHAGDHGMWIPFFDRLASTTTLPAILARRTGAAIVPIFCKNISPTRNSSFPLWKIEFGASISTDSCSDGEIMMKIHRKLEERILSNPADWFWLHDRWKTPSPNFLLKNYRRGVYVPTGTKLKPFRLLLRAPNWLGDSVLSIPAVRAIREGRPDIHLTIFTPPKLAELWKDQSFVDTVTTSLHEIKNQSFDAAILFPNSLRSALEAWFLKIPRRQGYAGHHRRWLLTAVCPGSYRSGFHEHDVKDFCGLARWSGAEVKSEIPVLDFLHLVNPKSEIRNPKSYLVLHPGAAYGSAKRWLPERFVELVQRFPREHWCVIGSQDECERNAQLTGQMGNHVEDWTGRLNLTQLVELLAHSKVVVCNDSGPMHLAAAAGAKVVAIFGSTEPQHTGPLGEGHGVIQHHVECSPCYLRECPIDLRCMKGVSVEEVEKTLRQVLDLSKDNLAMVTS